MSDDKENSKIPDPLVEYHKLLLSLIDKELKEKGCVSVEIMKAYRTINFLILSDGVAELRYSV